MTALAKYVLYNDSYIPNVLEFTIVTHLKSLVTPLFCKHVKVKAKYQLGLP